MNKLLKIVLVNLMGLVDYNGVLKEFEAGVKGKSEIRLIVMGISGIAVGAIMVFVFNLLGKLIINKDLILFVGFIISTILSFGISIIQVGPIVFKNEDTEYLFSLPLNKHQIIFSKIISIYIRNLILVIIVMLPCILSYSNFVKVNETMVLIYIVESLFIPIVSIILSVLIFYFLYYIKFYCNKVINVIIKILSFFLLILMGYLLFNSFDVSALNNVLEIIYERLRVMYFPSLLFVKSVSDCHIISFVLYLIFNVFVLYIFMLFMLKNYNNICSLLKGIKKKNKFIYKERISLGKGLGTLRKEILFVFNNKLYFNNSYGLLIFISLLLMIVILFIPFDKLLNVRFYDYYCLFAPFVIAGVISFGNSCINSISLEKNSVEMLFTLPMKIEKVIFYKWLCNVFICSIVICFDVSVINFVVKPDVFTVFSSYLLPLIVVMFISLLSILLDYRFVVKNEIDDGVILKQRVISLVPSLISFMIIFIPLFFRAYILYKYIICSFAIVCLVFMLISYIYLLINRKKLRKRLIM